MSYTTNAFMLPSDVECCSVALLEGLCCGLPCVTSAAGIADEVIDETTGVLLADTNPDTILAGMKKVRHHRYDARLIRQRGMEIASPERYCARIKQLLSSHRFNTD